MQTKIISDIQVLPLCNDEGDPLFCCRFNIGSATNKVPYAWIDNLATGHQIRITPIATGKVWTEEQVQDAMEDYSGHAEREPFMRVLLDDLRKRQIEKQKLRLKAKRNYLGSRDYYNDVAMLYKPSFNRSAQLKRDIAAFKETDAQAHAHSRLTNTLLDRIHQADKGLDIVEVPDVLQPLQWRTYAFDAYEMNMIWGIMTSYPMVSYEQMSGTGSCPMEFRRVAKPIDKVITINSRIVFEKFLNKIRRWHCLTSPEGSPTRGATSLVPLPDLWNRIRVAEDYLKLSEAERKQLVGDTLTAMSYCSVIDMPGQSSVWSVYKAAKSYRWDTVTGQYTAQRLFRDLRHMNEWRVMTYGEPIRKEQLAKAEELRQHDERVERRKAKARQQVSAQEPTFVESVTPARMGAIPVVPFQERESLVGCGDHLPKDQRILFYTKLIPDVALPIEDQAEQWDQVWWNQLCNGIPYQGELAPVTPEQTELLSARLREKYGE